MWRSIRAALVLVTLVVSGRAEGLHRVEAVEPHMGTLFRIVVYAQDNTSAREALRKAFARIAQLDNELSDYNPQSELMRACRLGFEKPVTVSPDLLYVLEKAQILAGESEGAFDVTLGPVIHVWRTARSTNVLPSVDQLAKARAASGFRKLTIDHGNSTIKLAVPDMQIDLGAIAKGYAADEALKILKADGLNRALVAASGDLAIGDAPPDKPGWRVGVGSPDKSIGRFAQIITLSNMAVSTSGDTEQYVEIGGVRYSHIVDPQTGIGLTTRISVTVIAPNGIDADSLATTASVLTAQKGIETGLRFVEHHLNATARIARQSGSWDVRQSDHGFFRQPNVN